MTSSPATGSQWHSVTPATRPLSLTILELTPLALTLSLTLASPLSLAPATPSAAARKRKTRGHAHHRRDSDNDDTEHEDADGHHVAIPGSWPLDVGRSFKDLLSHGVVVSVNGQPWNRIVAHVSDPEPEPEHEVDETPSDTEAAQEAEWEEGEWDHAGARSDEEGAGVGAELGVQRRRPRRARFMLSAQDAIGAKSVRKVRQEKVEERDRDRAVVVVYGLTPGKEYEVELRVIGVGAQDGEVVCKSMTCAKLTIVSNSILIPPTPAGARSRANSLRSRSNPRSRSNSTTAPPTDIFLPDGSTTTGTLTGSGGSTPPYPSDHSGSTTITPTPVLSAADTQAAQMRHLVASAHAEKEHLSMQIKEARRASQRAEAALRQEIESVKRAIEKAGSLDMRARQKTLALQEQVKQGWAGAEGAEESAHGVEGGMADLEGQLRAITLELQAVKEDLQVVQDKEEEIRERDRRTRSDEEKRLADMQARLDKQRKAKDKKAGEKADLEKRLDAVQKEQEETEKRFEEMRKRAAQQYGYNHHAHGAAWDPWDAHANHGNHRLANHPSMPNIGAGAAFRPRGTAYQPRFASGGTRPTVSTATGQVGPAQNSPTHPAGFATAPNHPRPVKPTTSPALTNRPPPVISTSTATSNAGPGSTASPAPQQTNLHGNVATSPAVGSTGTNPSAAPFTPSTASPIIPNANPPGRSSSPAPPNPTASPGAVKSEYAYDPSNHTTLMPPSLQHRIYFGSNHQGNPTAVRPRPSPNFHPPPSVLAEQAQRAHQGDNATQGQAPVRKGSVGTTGTPPMPDSPSFPPLPSYGNRSEDVPAVRSTSPLSAPGSSSTPPPQSQPQGPSLASIITRAVLQPGSGVLNQTQHQNQNQLQQQGGRRTASPPVYPQYTDNRPGIMSRRSSATIAPTTSPFGSTETAPASSGPKMSYGPSSVQNAILARGSNVLNMGPGSSRPNSLHAGNSSRAGSGDQEFPPLGAAVSGPGGQGQYGQQGPGGNGNAGPWAALNSTGGNH